MLPVVLLHGARTSRTMWRHQERTLERLGRPALACDLPGHGRRVGERFTVEGSLTAVGEAVAAVGGRAVLVGSSLGGYLGTAWAARHPDAVGGLVLSGCCTDPGTRVTDAWLLAARLIARLPDRGERLNAAVVRAGLPAEGARHVAEGGFALDVMVDLLTTVRAVRTLEDLAAVRCPVWFLNGRWDHFRVHERRFVRSARDAHRVVVPGANHLAPVSRPVAFDRAMIAALEDVDRAAAGDARS